MGHDGVDPPSLGDHGRREDGARLAYRPASRHRVVLDMLERPSAQQRIPKLAQSSFSRCAKRNVRQLQHASQALSLFA